MKIKIGFPVFLFVFIVNISSAKDREALINDLEESLMAPCCWSGTVADHGNPDMESQIRLLVDKGKSRQDVMDYFVSIYGERILAKPIAQGFNLMVWAVPAFIFLIAVGILINYIKGHGNEIEPIKVGVTDIKVEYDELIEKELKEME